MSDSNNFAQGCRFFRATGVNSPFDFAGMGIHVNYSSTRSAQIWMANDTDFLQFRTSRESGWGNVRTVWHNGNLSDPGSSPKFKENIEEFSDSALDILQKLKIKKFDYKDDLDGWATPHKGVKGCIGFLLDSDAPEEIKLKKKDDDRKEFIDKDNFKTIKGEVKTHDDFYNSVTMTGLLIKSVQELKEENNRLKGELNLIKEKLGI
ncbi:tail fiber domain-containing protein [Litoribacter populi]|uniref:tail fiber domain-containing protein n=1 Tax=Litoribacter populi TaxID=2598460 RepID=UPI00163DC009|nr:tail fiber domain-containing protein [Litoribacter populi]